MKYIDYNDDSPCEFIKVYFYDEQEYKNFKKN